MSLPELRKDPIALAEWIVGLIGRNRAYKILHAAAVQHGKRGDPLREAFFSTAATYALMA